MTKTNYIELFCLPPDILLSILKHESQAESILGGNINKILQKEEILLKQTI